MAHSDDPKRPGKFSSEAIQDAKAELFFGQKPMPSGRFKPGQSGNPNGRPKRAPELTFSLQDNAVHLATLRESRRLVTVKLNGTSTEVSMLDAVVQSQITNAVKGNPLAQRDALLRIERAYQQEAREIAASHEFWSRYRAEQWAEIERAKRNGKPDPNGQPQRLPQRLLRIMATASGGRNALTALTSYGQPRFRSATKVGDVE